MKKLLALLLLSPLVISETYYCSFAIGDESLIQKIERYEDVFKASLDDDYDYDTLEIIFEDDSVLMLSSIISGEYPSQESIIISKDTLIYQWAMIAPDTKIDANAVVSGKCLKND